MHGARRSRTSSSGRSGYSGSGSRIHFGRTSSRTANGSASVSRTNHDRGRGPSPRRAEPRRGTKPARKVPVGAGSNLADHLARAATCCAPQLQFWCFCACDLLHRSQRRALSPRNSAATAEGGGCSSGRKPAACIHQCQDSEPTRSWRLLACASAVARAGRGGESGGAAFESRMGLEALHLGSPASPAAMRGLRITTRIEGCSGVCAGMNRNAGFVHRVARRWHAADTF